MKRATRISASRYVAATALSVTACGGHVTSGGGGVCAPPLTTCPDGCVDVASDSHDCSMCGHDCLGGDCLNGKCQPVTLATGQGQPTSIAVDASSIYFANTSPGGWLGKVPVGGGSVQRLLVNQNDPFSLGMDGGDVFCAVEGAQLGATGAVLTVGKGGGSPRTLAAGLANPGGPGQLALDASNVYWTQQQEVLSCPLDACPGGPRTIAVAASLTTGIALEGGTLYWLEFEGYVKSCPVAGCTSPSVLTYSPGGLTAIAISRGHAYWTTSAGGTVMSCLVTDCAATLVMLATGRNPWGIAVDGSSVYWTDWEVPGSVLSCPLAGCPGGATMLASNQAGPMDVAVDSVAVYWTNRDDGTVMRVAK